MDRLTNEWITIEERMAAEWTPARGNCQAGDLAADDGPVPLRDGARPAVGILDRDTPTQSGNPATRRHSLDPARLIPRRETHGDDTPPCP
jgi:hypothetical protein